MTKRMPLIAYAIGQWGGYKPADHHWLIARALERVSAGECDRLMIFMPPRHGKSMLASEFFPAWWLAQHPDRQIIAATYAQDLADDFGRKVRNLCRSPQHKAMFPGMSLSEDSQAASRFHTEQGGVYHSVGAGAAITGRGAHLLLIDDPIKGREEAESETMRRRLKDWYTSVARTRLMPGGAIVVIQTRWHEDDLAGWLLREHSHEKWEVLNLPALAEPADPMGRDEGAPLWPECYPLADLERLKTAIGPRDWSSLYQQRPSAAEGSIFKRDRWRTYDPGGMDPRMVLSSLEIDHVIQAWDTAFKTKETNDYSVCCTIGISKARYYVLEVWRARVEFPDLQRAMISQSSKWRPHAVLIEDTSAGQSLIQELYRSTRLPIIPVKADKDKTSRAHAITPTHEAGLCYIPPSQYWASDFEDELASFPTAPHDDQVDAFVHAMTRALEYRKFEPEPAALTDEEIALRSRGVSWLS